MINIPTEKQWGDWKSDVDILSAHKIFFGKTNDEVQGDFYRCVIERADELRFMPDEVFQYYILGFRDFIMAGNFQLFDDADAASSFIKLIEYKLENSFSTISPLMTELMPSITYVCENQDKFGASVDTYGDFREKLKKIEKY